ncbi:hypothetical protein LEMA_P107760.1 [Plenodomus lingam JN3]|uniref:Uncharacterized protein n=1 Tax=Leptosphaeria maculans (strain JN3 / isolate v23.1.3 / race Av1-4-5-6-7-8) TaxID=985895 RepID=E4ZYI5_LEPMJ|nr:hypothetical protein LEMA_P107760.1 [Plenodomus lingam JN3]CBX96511.1 hypothetical protein LEMA_P107760.1 [Plenodomus lingam JN3]
MLRKMVVWKNKLTLGLTICCTESCGRKSVLDANIRISMRPLTPMHGAPICKDSWSKHIALVNTEMRAYKASGTCVHHWEYDVTHREPGDLSKFTRALVYLDFHTKSCATKELQDLDRYFGLLETKTKRKLKASACLDAVTANIANEWMAKNQNTTGNNISQGETFRNLRPTFFEAWRKAWHQLQEEQTAMEEVLKLFAYKLLYAGVEIWNCKPKCMHDESLCESLDAANDAIHTLNASLRRQDESIRALKLELKAAKDKTLETERMLKYSKRDVEKTYYEDVQKRVESRVADVKLELSDRLSTAESKALQYDKTKEENTALQLRVARLEKDSDIHRQARDDFEQQLKTRGEELSLLREGYEQLRTDVSRLQVDNNTLQVDIDDLKDEQKKVKREGDALREKLESTTISKNGTPSIMPIVAVTSFDRQIAALQHLDGLVSIWENALHAAIAKKDQSLAAKTATGIKVREAKAQVMQLKNARKPQNEQSPKSDERVGSPVPIPAKTTVAWTANTPRPNELPRLNNKPLVAKEAFPALGRRVTVSHMGGGILAWKTLRVVDGKAKAKKREDASK